eukprot:gene6517-7505_t
MSKLQNATGDFQYYPRTRQFPHVDGQWPTFICLRCKSFDSTIQFAVMKFDCDNFKKAPELNRTPQNLDNIVVNLPKLFQDEDFEEEIIETAQDVALCLSRHLKVKTDACEEVHISLSRTFTLQFGEIDSFMQRLRSAIAYIPEFSLVADLHGYIMTNEDRSRAFFCLGMSARPLSLDHLLDNIDTVLTDFNKPTFYTTRDIHISLVSWVIPPQLREPETAGAITSVLSDACLHEITSILKKGISDDIVISTTSVLMHCGNKVLQPTFQHIYLDIPSSLNLLMMGTNQQLGEKEALAE